MSKRNTISFERQTPKFLQRLRGVLPAEPSVSTKLVQPYDLDQDDNEDDVIDPDYVFEGVSITKEELELVKGGRGIQEIMAARQELKKLQDGKDETEINSAQRSRSEFGSRTGSRAGKRKAVRIHQRDESDDEVDDSIRAGFKHDSKRVQSQDTKRIKKIKRVTKADTIPNAPVKNKIRSKTKVQLTFGDEDS
ncbi:uncharacterized protein V1516DRAFT_661368 [Lipomyces oligophaga]|uniref:uncharacterized protein n=1 Tax=Lipomyces oligophaga TaxID=45792 RepID=UPI0034CDCD36